MLSILNIVGLVVLAVVVVLLGYISTRPDQFRIARKVTIKASPDPIFPLIGDLRRFNEWNPFAKADPAMKLVYGATSAGPGGSYNWDSTGQAGKGRMEITESDAPQRVEMELQFDKPMKANNHVVFTLQPQGSTTEVTWEMTGTYGFLHKTMGVVFNFDKMVGGEFEKGLAALKAQAEASK
jgi:Polyketide cyclase / dehydrase and lipid transport